MGKTGGVHAPRRDEQFHLSLCLRSKGYRAIMSRKGLGTSVGNCYPVSDLFMSSFFKFFLKRCRQLANFSFVDQPVSTAQNEPDARYVTILRTLKIENATVHNYVVDRLEVENLLLMENDEEARRLIRDRVRAVLVKCILQKICSVKKTNLEYKTFSEYCSLRGMCVLR